ncbi:MAG: DUF262 domain-containing protein [Arcobacteraceae bacterium]|nr:DUF262 domain-containing protein [Arcobacteraceae bacterium]
MHKLKESIPSTNMKIIELFNKIESGALVLDPDFQRKLVWKKQHKFHFIETILKNYPFPEVYIASSEINITTISAKEIVVDGQQRLSTIVNYIKEEGDFTNQLKIQSFNSLEDEDKKKFLNYLVTVKDLKDMNIDNIKEIFQRINNTEYSLNTVEKINAQYGDGEFIIFAKQLLETDYCPNNDVTDIVINASDKQVINDFFNNNHIFSENDMKRMIALQFVMSIIATMIYSEYFGRNSKVTEYIEEYNSNFKENEKILKVLTDIINFISSLYLDPKSYWFNKANLFSLIIELSKTKLDKIDKQKLKDNLDNFETESKMYFADINLEAMNSDHKKYFEYAKEAVNEKKSRIHRGKVIRSILEVSQ